MMQIHDLIKKARIDSGLTPEALATKIGVARTTYLYWEENTPSIDKVKKVEAALGLPENYFLDALIKTANNPDENLDTPQTVRISGTASGKSTAKGTLRGITSSGQNVFVEAKDLAASYERIIEEKEARRLEAKEWAERAEKEKDRLLKIIENNLMVLLSNSNATLDRLSLVETIVRSDDTVIMNNQDRQIGNEVGTSAKEAGSRQLAADKMRKGKGNQAGAHKPRT